MNEEAAARLRARIGSLSGRDLMQAAEQDGFEHARTRGDHFIYRKGSIVLSIPDHRTLKRGTASRLIKDMTDD